MPTQSLDSDAIVHVLRVIVKEQHQVGADLLLHHVGLALAWPPAPSWNVFRLPMTCETPELVELRHRERSIDVRLLAARHDPKLPAVGTSLGQHPLELVDPPWPPNRLS